MAIIKKKNIQLVEKLEYIESALSDTILTPELIDEICSYVKDGVPNKLVAKAIGVKYSTFLKWIRIGTGREIVKEANITDYKLFVKKLEQAEAQAKIAYIRLMKKAAEGGIILSEKETHTKNGQLVVDKKYSSPSWMAAAWFLERRESENFAKRNITDEIPNDEEKVDDEIFSILSKKEITQEEPSFLN